ncbi:MAG TPA: glycoside hydrolase family 57 protein [Verrucomicrobiae bacterium]|nr:glycoside hydrolase family 57 protein [Verrucomicrobiae bacterium]
MPPIRLLFLWHMHQPFYKDLVTGEYRLPWVRLHALKDYYGMVKLLDEFPRFHQTFNLVPSLIAQIQDYVKGTARDPFLDAAATPAHELGLEEKRFAIQYLFQANAENMIGRYPRYRELWELVRRFRRQQDDGLQDVSAMSDSDLTDLQVLSQIAWMDEFFLADPDVSGLVRKGRGYSLADQKLVISRQKEFLAKVLPAYASAAQAGTIEISTSPYYHPILPLVCDTGIGAVAHKGLPLPQRFRHPEDAREQILRGLDLHQRVFGVRPRGMWPSEGSVSDEVLALAHGAGLEWVATDEGVLRRSLSAGLRRDGWGRLDAESAGKLYRVYDWQQGSASMKMVFRDHSLSDLIGFVYSGMPAKEAARDLISKIKESAQPIASKGITPVVSVILDGENAWEYYPQSGREFLKRLYEGVLADPSFEPLTIAEAGDRETAPEKLNAIFPGSWINANFDVWIGSPEDNQSWDHLSAAHDFLQENAHKASPEQLSLAREELLIAEGSDWNWWYGPEHHSANDREFDELYRKHLSNVYHALDAVPPDVLAQPISAAGADEKPAWSQQAAYIHPHIDGKDLGYFDWLGAAVHLGEWRTSAMHGRVHRLETMYAGIDEENLYGRLDFAQKPAAWDISRSRLVLGIEVAGAGDSPAMRYRLEITIFQGRVEAWALYENGIDKPMPSDAGTVVALDSIFECRIPLALIGASMGSLLRVRFSLWQDQLPLDAMPQEGSLDLHVVPENELGGLAYAKP